MEEMIKSKVLMTMLISLICIVGAWVCFDTSSDNQVNADYEKIYGGADLFERAPAFSGRDVVILSDISKDGLNGAEGVKIQNTFSSIKNGDIVVIDGEWAESAESDYLNSNVRSLVRGGNLVISTAASVEAISSDNTGVASSFLESDDLKCIYYDPQEDRTYCFATNGFDIKETIDQAYDWAERVLTDSTYGKSKMAESMTLAATPLLQNAADPSWGDEVVIEYSEHFGGNFLY
jgi:hypothetical protein